jgi:hypothetical protein
MGLKTDKPIIHLGIEELNAVSLRLKERADSVHQFSLAELVADLNIAARACEVLAKLRFSLAELAEKTTDHDVRLELRGILDDANVAEPGIGQR